MTNKFWDWFDSKFGTKTPGIVRGLTAPVPTGLGLETTVANNFFEGTYYTEKVIRQMGNGDFHSFHEEVKLLENYGSVKTITDHDSVVHEMLEIPGSYKGYDGVFEFIKDVDGAINHRYFNPR